MRPTSSNEIGTMHSATSVNSPADGKHHNKHADDGAHRRDKLRDTLVKTLAERINIVRDAGKHVTLTRFVKIRDGQAVDLFSIMARRMLYETFAETPDIVNPLNVENSALNAYSPTRNSKTFAI